MNRACNIGALDAARRGSLLGDWGMLLDPVRTVSRLFTMSSDGAKAGT